MADTAEQIISFWKTDLKYKPVFDTMSQTLNDILNWKQSWYEMMQW